MKTLVDFDFETCILSLCAWVWIDKVVILLDLYTVCEGLVERLWYLVASIEQKYPIEAGRFAL